MEDRPQGIEESYGDTYSQGNKTKYRDRSRDGDRFRSIKRRRGSESPSSRGSESNTSNRGYFLVALPCFLDQPWDSIDAYELCLKVSESSTSNRGHWKSRTKRCKLADKDDLAEPWTCEDVDPFTPRIRNFKSSRKTRMPNNVKTYDRTRDPEDHLKIFQVAAQFDELPLESIDAYKGLEEAFLAYFMQQKKYVKDPVEIHNIKQRDGETIEDFMKWFKVETGRMKGAPECMRISRFMHGVNNPKLTKRLNEHVLKTMEEMMTVTTAFIRGEAAAASKKKGHSSWKSQDQSKRHTPELKSNFRGQSREGRGSSRFTPLTKTPKEILVAEVGKFKPPPPMVTPVEKRSSNKFCDFHNDKGHSTDECVQLKKQIEELVRAGKISHLIKEIKQGRDQTKNGKKEAPAKDKSLAIYMIQPWQRMTKQKLTQSFACVTEITFPPLANSDGTEGPLVIEAEIGGHMIHRMYIDGGSSTEGPELNYTPMEKLVLSLVFAAKRLRRTITKMECHARRTQHHVPPTDVCEGTNPSRFPDGSGAGLILTSPEGAEFTYTLRFQFTTSNNEAEYKALIFSIRIAAQIGIHNVHISVDSKLVANQVLGTYVAKEENMIKYLEKVKSLVSGFASFSINQVPRSKNKKADALSKIASTSFAYLSKQVLVEILKEKSIQEEEVETVVEEEGTTWMTSIMEYLKDGTLPGDRKEASKLCIKARQYELLEGILYSSQGYAAGILLANHAPGRTRDDTKGIDIAGPFSEGPGKVKFLIVDMDYFTKWIKAKAVATITGNQVKKFIWDSIVCRFGLPREIISDNDKQFNGNPFKDWCDKLNITQRFALVKHPQSNGLVERANQSLGKGIMARMGKGNKNWIEELLYVLWAHRTMIKSSHGDTPFSLTYGTEAVIPAEIGMPTYRTATVDTIHNDEELRLNLDLLEENNDASHATAGGKLGPKWEGPYEVTKALGDGAYKLRNKDGADLLRT
ncbi:reverse transcriptase domain-containing protein [Tanacetum coccineum]